MAQLGIGDKIVFFLLLTTLSFCLFPYKLCIGVLVAFFISSL